MADYEAVIGVEIHVQVKTSRKQFCDCPSVITRELSEANKYICPVCLGHPGVLPVLNEESVNKALVFGARIGSSIQSRSIFARKNYFYPDLPKGYQITQYHTPLLSTGELEYYYDGALRSARIERAHLEEDTAKIFYLEDGTYFLDYNRAGIPLLEIVTEPVFTSPKQVVAFLEELRIVLKQIEVSDANMEEGNFRCEPNVSVRTIGSTELLTKTEIKNLNSFAVLVKALEFEIERQIQVWRSGGTVGRATLRWDEKQARTVPMRTKETQADYRYFDEPDLPPLIVSDSQIETAKSRLGSYERKLVWGGETFTFPPGTARLVEFLIAKAQIPMREAEVLASEPFYLRLLAEVAEASGELRESLNWVLQEYRPRALSKGAEELDIAPRDIAEIIRLKMGKHLTTPQAREVFGVACETGRKVSEIIAELETEKEMSEGDLIDVCRRVMELNPKAVEDIKKGKTAAIKVLIGGVMKETRGSADPLQTEKQLRKLLNL